MDFPKKQAQRLMPLYLLEYSEKLFTNHPDPSAPWGGGGSEYTAGNGINISTGNVISVDNTVALKSDLPTNYVTLDTEQTITMPKRIDSRLTVGSATENEVFIEGNYEGSPIIDMYCNNLHSAFRMMIDNGGVEGNVGAYFNYEDDKGLREYRLPYQDREGLTTCTLATNLDIPSLDGYATQTWVQEQGYKTSITSSDITSALGYTPGTSNFSGSYNDLTDKPTLATVATTGSYNDLTDKPTIPDTTNLVTTNTDQTISGFKTFNNGLKWGMLGGAYTLQTIPVGFRYTFNDPQNPQQKDFSLPIEKSGTEYTLATTNDIPSLDGYATQTWVQNQGYATSSEIPTNYVTLDTDQTITGTKRFDPGTILIQRQSPIRTSLAVMPERFRFSVDDSVKEFYLPENKPSGDSITPARYTLATTDDIPSLDGYATQTWVQNQGYATSSSLATVATTGSYNDLADKPSIPNSATSTSTSTVTPTTIELVFTYEDNTTQTITLMTGATVSTSTTTTLS